MYSIDNLDTITERKDMPQSSVGAPCPVTLSGEHFLHLTYYLEEREDGWDGSSVHLVDEHSQEEPWHWFVSRVQLLTCPAPLMTKRSKAIL